MDPADFPIRWAIVSTTIPIRAFDPRGSSTVSLIFVLELKTVTLMD